MEQLQMRTFVMRDERRPVNLRAFALGPTRDSDVTLSDLSYGGCQIHSADAFEPGEILELRVVKRGLVQAEIRWAREDRAGACFIAA
jgi:PilZ domain